MPPRRRRPTRENIHINARNRKTGKNFDVLGRDTPERIEEAQKITEELAGEHPDTHVRIMRTSGRTSGSMSHLTQEQWDAALGKGKKGNGKGKKKK